MLRATCSADVHRCRPDSNNTTDTRVFAGSRRTTYRDQKNVCSRQKLPTTCNVRCTQARYEKQRSTKTKKNTVNVKYLRVATFVRFPTKDVLIADKRRVYMSCISGSTAPSHSGRHRSIPMVSLASFCPFRHTLIVLLQTDLFITRLRSSEPPHVSAFPSLFPWHLVPTSTRQRSRSRETVISASIAGHLCCVRLHVSQDTRLDFNAALLTSICLFVNLNR